jgi:hypothetical protein
MPGTATPGRPEPGAAGRVRRPVVVKKISCQVQASPDEHDLADNRDLVGKHVDGQQGPVYPAAAPARSRSAAGPGWWLAQCHPVRDRSPGGALTGHSRSTRAPLRLVAQVVIGVAEGRAGVAGVLGEISQGLPDDPEPGRDHSVSVAELPGERIRAHDRGVQAPQSPRRGLNAISCLTERGLRLRQNCIVNPQICNRDPRCP